MSKIILNKAIVVEKSEVSILLGALFCNIISWIFFISNIIGGYTSNSTSFFLGIVFLLISLILFLVGIYEFSNSFKIKEADDTVIKISLEVGTEKG